MFTGKPTRSESEACPQILSDQRHKGRHHRKILQMGKESPNTGERPLNPATTTQRSYITQLNFALKNEANHISTTEVRNGSTIDTAQISSVNKTLQHIISK